jgi:nitrate/TMAO reductase-like tetraheme cytochrome c subunit
MAWRQRLRDWSIPVLALGSNNLTLVGAVLTTSAGLTLVGLFFVELLQGGPSSPYAGIVFYLILPGVFALGLALMPLGVFWRRRRLRASGEGRPAPIRLSWADPLMRRAMVLAGGATVANVLIMGAASYKGIEEMDSVQFCGLTCHSVMAPEYAAYEGSPHSRVACVDCHIGPGAPWFVRSKLSGTRQIFAVAFGTYSRPIPSPVEHLRPARETCEQCHWPAKFQGDRLLVKTSYAEDEANTPSYTVLLLKVGGRTYGHSIGIHGRHLGKEGRVVYETSDRKRSVITRVSYREDDGSQVEFVADDGADAPVVERRTMDCMDCHNRPTHTFQMPGPALDKAISEGGISSKLPFVKKEALALLKATYPDQATARRKIHEGLTTFYQQKYPKVWTVQQSLVEQAAQETSTIYCRNVFPNMKVTWGTYPNYLGHEESVGCFRCHDESHTSKDGRTITQDCSACHELLAMDEENPKILSELGLK